MRASAYSFLLLQQNTVEASLQTVFDRVVDYLTHTFVIQDRLKFSVLTLLLAILVVLIAAGVSRYVRRVLGRRVLDRLRVDAGTQYTLLRVLHYLIITLGVLYGLRVGFAVDLTSVAVILGFLSLGIGFGLQYIAADIVSGFILLFERPVRVGDRVKLDDGVEGRVESIAIRSTIIVTNENLAVIVPNSNLIQNRLVNYSYGDQTVRLNVPVGVAYGSDLDVVTTALIEAARSVPEVLENPAPKAHFKGFGDSSLDFEVRLWISEPHRHPQISSSVNFAIDRAFRKHGVQIPFPQRDLHLRSGTLSLPRDRDGDD